MKLLYIIVFIAFTYSLSSENIQYKIYAETSLGSKADAYFGIHKDATNGLDYELNEFELPPFDPPGGAFFAVFEFMDSTVNDPPDLVWSNIDLRPIPTDKDTFFIKYTLYTGARTLNETLILRWLEIPSIMDSAKILVRDPIENITFVDVNMKETNFAEITQLFRKIEILIWYNKNPSTYVNEINEVEQINVYPNPTSDYINITTKNEYVSLRIYDLYGRILLNYNNIFSDIKIDVSNYYNGLYQIELINKYGTIRKYKFIKY